jgi:hypothetical protein
MVLSWFFLDEEKFVGWFKYTLDIYSFCGVVAIVEERNELLVAANILVIDEYLWDATSVRDGC